jgi:putative ATP-binding cassette transporter
MKKYLIGAVVLSLIEIAFALYLTAWREHFWNAVSTRDGSSFIVDIGIFTAIAIMLCIISASSSYLITLSGVKWREFLTRKANTNALSLTSVENLNQRIQEDCREYPLLMLNIVFGLSKAFAYFVVFATALILKFSYLYLLIIIVYAIVATYIAKRIAKPLISLNYKSQQVEATYRNSLTPTNFESCIYTMLGVAKKTKHLNYFQTLYGQLGAIIPLIIIAPSYFASLITIGAMIQANSMMGTIVESLSYGINSFDSINRLLSSRQRLKEIKLI